MKKSYDSFENRNEYRNLVKTQLFTWRTRFMETELQISAESDQSERAYGIVRQLRQTLDEYIAKHEDFGTGLTPIDPGFDAPAVVQDMCLAGVKAGVGPMAAVAGAFAKEVGSRLLTTSKQVIIENGGDVWLTTKGLTTIAIFAGQSSLSMKLGITVDAYDPIAICTSSGTVGHSTSFGKADAAVVVSYDACLADACATRLGNDIKTADDIEAALDTIYKISGVVGALAIVGEKCGAVGDLELVNL
ncbi:MAG: UPF0280 family protein [Clostridia bacterium]|nr:UPF0280 family protein [Clostridia bacterium]MBT7121981.1 UPF0280 family protein [Clostridia bacterium]